MKLAKLSLSVTLALVFALSLTTPARSQNQFIRGDADGDGLVGWLDAYYILSWVQGCGPIPPCMDAADVDDDGRVSLGDAIQLSEYVWGVGTPPPLPFPDPDVDPTPDGLDCANPFVPPTSSNSDSLIVLSACGSPGDTIAVPIVRNSQNILRYQIYLEFDPNILQVIGVDTTGTATGAAHPGIVLLDTLPSGGGTVEIWCVINCWQTQSIPIGRDTLIKIVFQVKACGPEPETTLLNLKNVTGPPFTGNLLYLGGGEVYPTLVDSNFISRTVDPEIISIKDVGNDQGKQVRVRWNRSCYDNEASPVTITEYSIWRRIDQYLASGSKGGICKTSNGNPYYRMTYPPGDWDFIKTVPARGESTYSTICPTLADSTEAGGMYWSVFFVSAMTTNPLVYFDSYPDSGFSLDNIPPMPIATLDIPKKDSTHLLLTWTVPGEYPGEQAIFSYDIRYNTIRLGTDTTTWWNNATPCSGEQFYTFSAGEVDSFKASFDPIGAIPYYFAIKAEDQRPNESFISNIFKYRCGDVDGNILINLADVIYLANYLLKGGPSPIPTIAGDVDCKSKINLADVIYLANYVLKNGPPLCTR